MDAGILLLGCWHLVWSKPTAFGIPLLCIKLDPWYGMDRAPQAKQGCPLLPPPRDSRFSPIPQ